LGYTSDTSRYMYLGRFLGVICQQFINSQFQKFIG
jgi:hypothetical protein